MYIKYISRMASSINIMLWVAHILCILISQAEGGGSSFRPKPLAPALYVFGDSLFDSGNNNLLPTLAKALYKPYGVDFPGGPTGRFTNGRTVADFIAEYLGLPYPPPIIRLFGSPSYTGFNYASAASGILNQTGSRLGKCLNLEEQINHFEATVQEMIKKRYSTEPRNASFHLSKSIFIFSTGSNDLTNYLDPKQTMAQLYTPKQFSQLLIHHLSHKLQRLYKLGTRKVVFFELGPIGCMPNQAKTTKHKGLCNININRIVSDFNSELRALLSNLSNTLPGSHFVLGRAYSLGYDAVVHPLKYGFSNSTDPCCKAWFNNTVSCIPGLKPCRNHNQHFFWDGYHPTEAACSLIASHCITGSSTCIPFNIKHLVQL